MINFICFTPKIIFNICTIKIWEILSCELSTLGRGLCRPLFLDTSKLPLHLLFWILWEMWRVALFAIVFEHSCSWNMNIIVVTGQEEYGLNLGLWVVECGYDADSTANCTLVQCKVQNENRAVAIQWNGGGQDKLTSRSSVTPYSETIIVSKRDTR
jgi:hypothetical protein